VGFVGFVGSPVKVGVMENGVEVLPVALAVPFGAADEPGGRAERDLELEDGEKRKEQSRERG
jgi:hypothetical protein